MPIQALLTRFGGFFIASDLRLLISSAIFLGTGQENPDIRLKRIKGDLAALELKKQEGKVLDTEEVVRRVQHVLGSCRSRLLAIPTTTAPEIALLDNVAQCRSVIEKHIHQALNEISNYDPLK